jgi:hypothetical protein
VDQRLVGLGEPGAEKTDPEHEALSGIGNDRNRGVTGGALAGEQHTLLATLATHHLDPVARHAAQQGLAHGLGDLGPGIAPRHARDELGQLLEGEDLQHCRTHGGDGCLGDCVRRRVDWLRGRQLDRCLEVTGADLLEARLDAAEADRCRGGEQGRLADGATLHPGAVARAEIDNRDLV